MTGGPNRVLTVTTQRDLDHSAVSADGSISVRVVFKYRFQNLCGEGFDFPLPIR